MRVRAKDVIARLKWDERNYVDTMVLAGTHGRLVGSAVDGEDYGVGDPAERIVLRIEWDFVLKREGRDTFFEILRRYELSTSPIEIECVDVLGPGEETVSTASRRIVVGGEE